MKKYLLYSIYVISVTACFAYYLFPSEEVKAYIASRLNRADSDYEVTIGSVAPAFPPGIKFHDVSVSEKGNPVIRAEWLKIGPDLLTLFAEDKTLRFKGGMGEGDVQGTVLLSGASGSQIKALDATLSQVPAEAIGTIQTETCRIGGKVDGNISHKPGAEGQTDAKLRMSEGHIDILKSPSKLGMLGSLIKPGKIEFNTVETDISMNASRKIEIKGFDAKGPQISGNLSGSITLKTPSDRSVLDIGVNLTPHPAFIATLGKGAAALIKRKSGKDGLSFKIRGTFGRPRPSF